MATRTTGTSRADLVADAALALLAERGMRGLTHRAVDERAGLPQGSTSNCARTRQSLLEAAVRRLAEREARVLATDTLLPAPAPAAGAGSGPEHGGPDTDAAPATGAAELVAGLALVLHRYLTGHPELLVCRYELALEATRRPKLREFFDATGRQFREPLLALLTAAGSTDPERHTLSLVAWCEGLMFSCAAGSYSRSVPSEEELRAGFAELLGGMLGPGWAPR
ncbi:TetR/AcrR family transcriptional regulator [Streptomyces sp. NPDC001732]